MKAKNKNSESSIETMIVFYLLLLSGTIYFLVKLGIKVFENL